MLEQWVQPVYQRWLLAPIAAKLQHFAWVKPNVITLIGVLAGILAALAIAWQWSLLAVGLLVFSGFCDSLDGALARQRQVANPTGAVLDIVADRVVEFVIVYGLFWLMPEQRAVVTVWMLGSILICVTTFLVVGIFAENDSAKSFHYSPGMMERAEAFIFFALMILVPAAFSIIGWLFVTLVMLTAVIRMVEFYRQNVTIQLHKRG